MNECKKNIRLTKVILPKKLTNAEMIKLKGGECPNCDCLYLSVGFTKGTTYPNGLDR